MIVHRDRFGNVVYVCYLSDHDNRSHIFPPEMLDDYEYGERFKGSQKISYDKLET